MTRRDATRRHTTPHHTTRRDATPARHDAARRDATRRDATPHHTTPRDATRHDTTRRMVGEGLVRWWNSVVNGGMGWWVGGLGLVCLWGFTTHVSATASPRRRAHARSLADVISSVTCDMTRAASSSRSPRIVTREALCSIYIYIYIFLFYLVKTKTTPRRAKYTLACQCRGAAYAALQEWEEAIDDFTEVPRSVSVATTTRNDNP